MPKQRIRSYAPSELRSSFALPIFSIHEIVKAWPFLPADIQAAICSIVQHTMRKPLKIEGLNLAIKRLYLELSEEKHFENQTAIVREIMKRTGIASRSTVMKHLAAIRRADKSFPRRRSPNLRS